MPLDLGVRIRQARLHRRFTQAELAGHLGVHRSAVAQWESNKRANPTTRNLELVAHATQVRFEWLATGRGQMRLETEDVANAITMNVFARDSMEVTLLEWFRAIPARARVSFIEHLRALGMLPQDKVKRLRRAMGRS